MHRVRTLAFAAALLSACTVDPSKLDPRRSAAAVCPVLFDEVVAKFQACEGMAPYYADRLYASTQASCAMVAAGEAAGRIGYDRAVADACLSALGPATGCAALGACSAPPFVGQVAVGGSCYDQIECAAGLYCTRPLASGSCPGTCLAPGAVGARCLSVDPPCAADAYCDTAPVVPACAAKATLGQACGATPCADHLRCVFAPTTGLGTCLASVGVGGSCGTNSDCDTGLYCDSAGVPTCRTIPSTPQAQGQSCAYPLACGSGLYCDATLVCQPQVAAGAACSDFSACLPPARCIADGSSLLTRHCVTPLAEGQPCTPGLGACQTGLSCAVTPTSATCTRFPGVGSQCGVLSGEDVGCLDSWCSFTGTTSAGVCTAFLAPGAACISDQQCGGGGFGADGARCLLVAGGRACVAACVP